MLTDTAPADDSCCCPSPTWASSRARWCRPRCGPRLSAGPLVQRFESDFARWLGRGHAVAVASGTLGTWLALRALGIGPGDEVIASAYGWHQVAHAVTLTGATLVFADIDYWSGCLDPARAARR
jgi:perosamine synthetase